MKIAIIGCGFAGLVSAILLAKQNHQIIIYERFSKAQATGAGIMLQPSTWKILKELKIFEKVHKLGEKIYMISGQNPAMKEVFSTNYSHGKDFMSYGIGILRSTVFNLLFHQLADYPNIELKTNHLVEDLEEYKKNHDLVVICNGSKSELRHQLPINKRDEEYPWGCVWTVIENNYDHVNYLQQYVNGSKEMFGFLPSGKRSGKRVLSVFWSLPIEDGRFWLENETQENKNNYKAQMFQKMQKYIRPEIMTQLKKSDYIFSSYHDVWMEKYNHDNCVVIGDAAHAMSPQLGQGANMAFLDAYELSQSLKNEKSLEECLLNYEKSRRSHVDFYTKVSKFLTPLYQSHQPHYGIFRDILFSTSKKIWITKKISADILAGSKKGWFQ